MRILADPNWAFNSWGVAQVALITSKYQASNGPFASAHSGADSQNLFNVPFAIILTGNSIDDSKLGSSYKLDWSDPKDFPDELLQRRTCS